ncbi:MAG: hypothetical protein E6J32_07875 [Chloroflexi bacterium]|nr:MAG: hypothetical protein E6J32_07875 [Chloroflexota bacterium]
MTRRTIAAVAGCLLAIIGGVVVLEVKQPGDITKKLGSLVLIVQGHPEAVNDIDQREAVAAALGSIQARNLENGAIPVTGYRLTSAYHAFGLTRATTRDGRSTATWGDPKEGWALEFAAPPQQGWAHVSAFVVIDARSGNVDSFSEAKNN